MPQVTPAEISRLFDEHGRALRLFAAQWCRDSDDVVQESLIALAAVKERPDDPLAWLYGVVRNKARMSNRAQRRRHSRERVVAEANAEWFETSHENQLDAKAVQTSLAHLDEETREIIVAYIWGELTFEQIGDVVGTSASTAHRRFVQGLQTLREKLGVTWTMTSPSMKS